MAQQCENDKRHASDATWRDALLHGNLNAVAVAGEVDSSLLAAAFGRLTSLKHLSLTNTGLVRPPLPPFYVGLLLPMIVTIATPSPSFHWLPRQGPEFISALVKTPLFDNESTLSSLELGYNSIGDTGAVAIAHAMVTKGMSSTSHYVPCSYPDVLALPQMSPCLKLPMQLR